MPARQFADLLFESTVMSTSFPIQTIPLSRSEQLLEVLQPFQDLVVLMHDNPDPDAISSGWALQRIIQECLDRPARLIGGGAIVRAENRHMISLLEPPIELASSLVVPPHTGIVLVDCGVESLNRLAMDANLQLLAVVDHHPPRQGSREKLPFEDVRPEMAASATIAASYMRELNLQPDERLATALVYAIRSETRGCETGHSRLDRLMIRWLTRWANPTWLAEIESAPLSRAYYSDFVLALQSTFLYDDAAFCLLPRAEGAEVVGELADLLVRCEGINRVMRAAAIDEDVLLSVRTTPGDGDAGAMVRELLKGLGRGGGHAHRAGGRIPGVARGRIAESLEEELRSRWLAVCNSVRERGTRLIARREILEHL